ncbi:uncharacterized transposon-derived [Paramuricea clavata]|uniref:Uncharacterized transposon-derived n=1 Tax=Paramuricea clavata TaxID=317549 RepID=A0A7D9DKK0_PARCT|nr:uncharacterized transposon-derived [Paramuricea clavata]
MSSAEDTFIYDSGIEMSHDEMEALADALPTMSKSSQATNYAELGESKDSFGNEYRVILKCSKYDGLKICKMKKPNHLLISHRPKTTISRIQNPSTATPTTSNECWSECFDKFYINKNDWKKIANIICDFCCDAYSVLNSSSPAGIDVIPPTPLPTTPVEQKQLEPAKKQKYNNTKSGEAKKKKTKVLQMDEEATSEVRVQFNTPQELCCATKIMLAFMCKYKKGCEETIAQFGNVMNEQFPYPYKDFLVMLKKASNDFELIKKAARLLKGETLTKEQKNLYTLHAKKIHRIKRLKIRVYNKNEQWSIDLADLNELSGYNNQYRYILVCVDVAMRYTFVKMLKTKSGKNVCAKFEEIIHENGPPKKIQADEVTEFNDIKKTGTKIII